MNIRDDNNKIITVTEDFYAFKYMYLDKLDALQQASQLISADFNLAQTAAAHTNINTTNIYTVNHKKRENEILKNIKIR
ncbi:hypothetical protein [Chryseobacterium nematophagum]|nr:hypothetical protein [Chryseobacterium nematophagum]